MLIVPAAILIAGLIWLLAARFRRAGRTGTRVRRGAAPRAPAADSPAQRPLQGLPREQLEARLARALLGHDGVAGAHCSS